MTTRQTHRLLWGLIALTLIGGAILSHFRVAVRDETYYLREAATMADCFRQGRWIGNEAVGLHGFLFKIPAALLFLVFGTSVYAATLVTVLIAALAAWLCFRVLRTLLQSDAWALAGTWMLITNFAFLRLTPTFNRDLPALFALLLLLDAILHRRSRWIIGLLLLLLFDAKEYLCFMVLPWFGLWVVFDERRQQTGDGGFFQTARQIMARWTAGVLPTVVAITLMFCTGLVPLNMFVANTFALTQKGLANPALARFKPHVATAKLEKRDKPEDRRQHVTPELSEGGKSGVRSWKPDGSPTGGRLSPSRAALRPEISLAKHVFVRRYSPDRCFPRTDHVAARVPAQTPRR